MLAWMEGSEAVRPNDFPQLAVSAIADDPTTSLAAGPPPPQGADSSALCTLHSSLFASLHFANKRRNDKWQQTRN